MSLVTSSSTRNVARFLNKRIGVERKADRQLTNEHFDDHHLWYPRRHYIGNALANLFRSLPCQRVVANRGVHSLYHSGKTYPKPPTRRQMRKQIIKCRQNGCKGGACVMPIRVVGQAPACDLPDHIVFVEPTTINLTAPKAG